MRVPEIQSKIKARLSEWAANETVFLAVLVCAVSAASFMLGRVSLSSDHQESVTLRTSEQVALVAGESEVEEKPTKAVRAIEKSDPLPAKPQAATVSTEGQYVGSKNSNKYHLPWCSGAKTISEENKVWFVSKDEAEAKGYIPAANCKGI